MTDGPGRPADAGASEPRPRGGAVDRCCDAIDALNRAVGVVGGFSVCLVTLAVIYEVVARTTFGSPTQWANETTVYLSAMTYLLAGGYVLLNRGHVRIDVLYGAFTPRTRTRLDAVTFVFFVLYAGTLVWVGAQMGWMSLQQNETTGTPWNPYIWPVKLAIPAAGLLLLLQGVADLLRDLGVAAPRGQS
jgi:TRAP-type mannitol/chloroaromatic compound transport system permease small subunit